MVLKPHAKHAEAEKEEEQPQDADADALDQGSTRRNIPEWIIVLADSQEFRREG